jgi:hypothetical protein
MKNQLYILLLILENIVSGQSIDSLYKHLYSNKVVYLGFIDEELFTETDTTLKGNHLFINSQLIDSTGEQLTAFPKYIYEDLYFPCVNHSKNYGLFLLSNRYLSKIAELITYQFGFSNNLIITSDFRSLYNYSIRDKNQNLILDMRQVFKKDIKWLDEDYKIIIDEFWIDDDKLFFSFAECPVNCSNYKHYLFKKSDNSIKELRFLKSKSKNYNDEYTCLELTNSDQKSILGFTDRSLDSNMIGRWLFNDTLRRVRRILSMNQRYFVKSPDGHFNYDAPYIVGYNYNNKLTSGINYRSELDNKFNVIVPYKFSIAQEFAMLKVYYDSLLTQKEVSSFGKYELSVLRNLIFAKHNYKFESDFWQAYFNLFEFYRSDEKRKSRTKDVERLFTAIDKKNLGMLKKAEKMSKGHYLMN